MYDYDELRPESTPVLILEKRLADLVQAAERMEYEAQSKLAAADLCRAECSEIADALETLGGAQ